MPLLNGHASSRFTETEISEKHKTLLGPVFTSFANNYRLTSRETQVLKILVLEGKRNDEIAGVLFISPKTLKNHLAFMMRKTGTGSARSLLSLFFHFAIRSMSLA